MMKRFVATALAVAFALSLGADLAVAAAKPAPSGKVNINTASVEQLTTLPGVGPKLAARILEYRQKSGAFKSVQELMNVKNMDSCKSIVYMQLSVGLFTGNTQGTGKCGNRSGPAWSARGRGFPSHASLLLSPMRIDTR
jgi:competence ComEA-like helix-hairpin-helix protein